ncbi:MAG: sulfatase-like hydrolase/transferase [Anaerolineales bacterium]|nr:sulfatase-like hydrolase/transferase [Anaerolineales bacterium]
MLTYHYHSPLNLAKSLITVVLLALLGSILAGCQTNAADTASNAELIPQEIRYRLPEAEAVTLIWGINDWSPLPDDLLPRKTKINDDDVMETIMAKDGEFFDATIQVPQGAILNYGFFILNSADGYEVNVWEPGEWEAHGPVTEVRTITEALNHDLVTTQTIYYETTNEAGQVLLSWGIDGWQYAPKRFRPSETYIKDYIMRTPMQRLDDTTFVTEITLPYGTLLNYGFSVEKNRQGGAIWVWDGDDATDRVEASANNVVRRQGGVELTYAKILPQDFTEGPQVLLIVAVLLGLVLLMRQRFLQVSAQQITAVWLTIGIGIGLFALLFLFRLRVAGFGWVNPAITLPYIPQMVATGYYDFFYVAGLTAVFAILQHYAQTAPTRRRWLGAIYIGLVWISLFIGFANIPIVRNIGRPFNYQWLYYSDFLLSNESRSAFFANITGTVLLNVVTLFTAVIAAGYLFTYLLVSLQPRFGQKSVNYLLWLTPCLLYVPFANWTIQSEEWEYSRVANPITSFVESVIEKRPSLYDPSEVTDMSEFLHDKPNPSTAPRSNKKVENVVLFVLESMPAEYIEAFGGIYPVNPNLQEYRDRSAIFTRIYAHAPSSNKSLAAILGGIYPNISYMSLTAEQPDIELPTLSSELSAKGYRTGFFNASDWSFSRGDEFIAHRKFDYVGDATNLTCDNYIDIGDQFTEGIVNEQCVIDAFTDWHGQGEASPFFAMFWTGGTHYPYYVYEEEIQYDTNNASLNRYLNAQRNSDKAFGRLLDYLKAQNLLDTTLIIVVGDHGEAFGRHAQSGHASYIYEENVHVPLVLINPLLFTGETYTTIGGDVDLAPTIFDLLELPPHADWEGNSLFSTNRSGRTYFFAPWSDLLFGMREDNFKLIFNASSNKYELYDLSTDPYETQNLADEMPEVVEAGHKRLAAWVQYHDQYMAERMTVKP